MPRCGPLLSLSVAVEHEIRATGHAKAESPGRSQIYTDYVADVKDRLTNVEARVKSMDEAGVALTIISLTMPGIEGIFDAAKAVETAKKVNDEIHQIYLSGPHKDQFPRVRVRRGRRRRGW